MKNEALFRQYKEFCKEAIGELLQLVKEEPIPTEQFDHIEKTGPGSCHIMPREKPLLIVLIGRCLGKIRSLPSYEPLFNGLNEELVKVYPERSTGITGNFRFDFDHYYAGGFLAELLGRQGFREFQESEFERLYAEFEESLYSDKIEYVAIVPLENFTSDQEEIKLGSKLRIRKITEDEIDTAYRACKTWGEGRVMGLMYATHAIEVQYAILNKLHVSISAEEARAASDSIVSALRLLKRGAVGYGVIHAKPKCYASSFAGFSQLAPTGYRFGGLAYNLQGNDVTEFTKLLKLSESGRKKHKFLDLAMRRLNYAYERRYVEDKLVDYMIGFEALYLKEEERSELSYKLSLRTAVLLGGENERKTLFKFMKDAYDLRSKIVHGSTREIFKEGRYKGVPLNEFVEMTGERLRQSIRKFLDMTEKYANYSSMIASIDGAILGENAATSQPENQHSVAETLQSRPRQT